MFLHIMNGKGKIIYSDVSNLAQVKQLPYLIRGIKNTMPEIEIRLAMDPNDRAIFEDDMRFNGIDLSNIAYKGKSDLPLEERKAILDIELDYCDDFRLSGTWLRIHIDPLKFEKRRLLNNDEVKDLREKYKIQKNETVILGCSMHQSDMTNIIDALVHIAKKEKKKKCIMVSREGDGHYWRGLLENHGLKCECDSEKITGNSRFLFVDSKGFLDRLCSIADTALMGRTFAWPDSDQGQNPLEPAFYGKRIISGCKYLSWNKDAYVGLKQHGLLKIARNAQVLDRELLKPCYSSNMKIIRNRTADFIAAQQGSASIIAKVIQRVLYGLMDDNEKEFLSKRRTYETVKERYS